MAVGRSSHSKWLCSCSLSLPCPTSAYFTYTLLAGLTSPPPCPTAQLTIAYQTADEESTPQVVSAINRFCATVGLGAHAHGFLSAHACVVRARLCACALVCVSGVRMRACLGVRMHVWVPECVHGCVFMYMLAGMCVRVRMCQCAWLRAWASVCVSGCLSACMRAWAPVCVGACLPAHLRVHPYLSL